MTIEDAAQAAADRLCDGQGKFELRVAYERDLCVRAFRQGAQWQLEQDKAVVDFHRDMALRVTESRDELKHRCRQLEKELETRGEPLITSPRPSTGSTASSIEAVRPFQSCHCPAAHGEPCPLTLDECASRSDDYVGLPWFGARLRRIWDGFVNESLNGVVCSIPDTGLNTPAHRTWCVRCQRRYMELKALVEMLDSPVTAATDTAESEPRGKS